MVFNINHLIKNFKFNKNESIITTNFFFFYFYNSITTNFFFLDFRSSKIRIACSKKFEIGCQNEP